MTVPAERAIDLDSFLDGWRGVRYTEDFSAGRWRAPGSVDTPENLAHRQLALAGRAGYGVSVAAVQKFTSGRPLESIVIRLRGSCNPSNLGGTFQR